MPTTTKTKKNAKRFVVDAKGRPTAVLLPIGEYEELLEAAEQKEDIRHLEQAKKTRGEAIDWEEMKSELRAKGKLD